MDINTLLKQPLVPGAVILIGLLLLGLFASRANMKKRIDELEKQIDDIRGGGAAPWANPPISHTGTAVASNSGEFMVEVERLVRANQLIQAIKLYRENTGLGLKESKDAVDALKRQMNL